MTSERTEQRRSFLSGTQWHAATANPIAGDASARQYWRLTGAQTSAILMDADPSLDLKTAQFVKLANHLRNVGLSAPDIYASDLTNGFVVLEDFGTDLVAERSTASPAETTALYAHLSDIALHIWANPPKTQLPVFDATEMAGQLDLFEIWYCANTPGSDRGAANELVTALAERLTRSMPTPPGMIHRDYHVQNLVHLATRTGLASIGLLDFQDAMAGPQSYDIASLLTDARQDVSPDLRRATLDYATKATGRSAEEFGLEFALCAAQRNLRIIGIFARLALRDGKPAYPTLLPRVFGYVVEAFDHPALNDLAPLFERAAAAPSASVIAELQAARAQS